MSTAPQKDDVAQDIQQQQEQKQEKQIQDIEMEADNQKKENNASAATKEEEQETSKEKTVVTTEKETVEILVQTATEKLPTETSHTKRKVDAFSACNSASEPFNNEHQKTKKERATKLMKVSATKKINQSSTKTKEFSFARPTESSARRTAALSENHTKNMKATPPSFKLQQLKRTPAKAQYASTPVYKIPTGADAAVKASRSHLSYTPYIGPLPPLTVESSFAPKNGQSLNRRVWSVSPAQMKGTAGARKPRLASAMETQLQSTTGKENSGVNKEKKTAANAASSSQISVTPGKTGFPVSKEENWSSSKEKDESQRSLAQQANPIDLVQSSATAVEPTV